MLDTNQRTAGGGDWGELQSPALPDVLRHGNGEGKLDASDPAFAAIKLWVDVNHNGRMDEGESTGLQSIQPTSADTEGVKLDTVEVVGADGKLKELDASALVVHEHYDGKTHTVSYELQAKVTGDWEKTADAAAQEGTKARRSKSIRPKVIPSPHRMVVYSYETCSNRKNRQRRVREALHRVRNFLSPVRGICAQRVRG